MIVKILVAKGQSIDSLLEKIPDGVTATGPASRIFKASGCPGNKINCSIRTAEKACPAIGGYLLRAENSFNFFAFTPWKFDRF
jgi:hypothetical protein